MKDNPQLTARDRDTVSEQPHEIRYVMDVLKKEFPRHTAEQVSDAVAAAKKTAGTKRDDVLEAARNRLQKDAAR